MAAFAFTDLLPDLRHRGSCASTPVASAGLGAGLGDYTAARSTQRCGPWEAMMANDTATVWRLYSIEDGTTRMEQVAVPLGPDRTGVTSKLLAGPGVMIRRSGP